VTYYRCYLTDAEGHIRDFNKIDARSDREALEATLRQVGSDRNFSGFELWQGGRLIHRENGNRPQGSLLERGAATP